MHGQAQPQSPPPFNLKDAVPFDPAIHKGVLPNGLTYYVRQNKHPEKRVSMRLAVKAGSLHEADDQQGLAHLIEHMAFNGSAHYKPGEMFAYFERVGARLGPHVNAYTSFDETVYQLDLPSDSPDVLSHALLAFSDDAGGLTLDPKEVDKERPVVIEEWRLGLGAGARVRDKQFPLLFDHSRYADRLPIGKPEIIRNAPAQRLRDFYDTWYRPDHMAIAVVGDIDIAKMEQDIKMTFTALAPRAPAAKEPDRSVPLHQETLISIVTDPELTRSSVQIVRKRPREGQATIADYRRDLEYRIIDNMLDERFQELALKPDAQFLGAGVDNRSLSPQVATFTMAADVQDGKLEEGVKVLATEAKRVRDFGFGAAELDRAKKSMLAFYQEAFKERDKTDSSQLADEYLRNFLIEEPSPGIAYEYGLVQQLLPTMTQEEVTTITRSLTADDSRVILAVAPQKAGVRVPTDRDLQAAWRSASAATVTAWTETALTTMTRGLMERAPTPGTVASRRTIAELGVTIVTFANGVEAWLKPTDFKNDQIEFSLSSPGGASLAPPAQYEDAVLATALVETAGAGGIKALDLQKMLSGKVVAATPYIGLSTHGIDGGSTPADLETALQLLYLRMTAPGDDAESWGVLKRQLDAVVANRGSAPAQVFGERLTQMNTSDHYTSRPLTADRVAALDPAKMIAFYKERFANAADFTFYMVGTFTLDEAVPLLARYVGSLPSTGTQTSTFRDVGIHFPDASQRDRVVGGQEPRGQTAISFFADPPMDPAEQEKVQEASSVLEIALRDILREDLGQTYSVSVHLFQTLPQSGTGRIEVRFGAAPENIEGMTTRVMQEIARLQKDGPSEDLTNRTKESARRSYETALKDNGYWINRLEAIHMFNRDPHEILTREQRINAITPQVLQEAFKKYFAPKRMTVLTLVPAKATP
jgi:zinc protease